MAKKTIIKESNAKLAVGLLISLLVFTIFILFYTNKETIFASGNLRSFLLLMIVGMGFLAGLLYLVNPPGSSRKRK